MLYIFTRWDVVDHKPKNYFKHTYDIPPNHTFIFSRWFDWVIVDKKGKWRGEAIDRAAGGGWLENKIYNHIMGKFNTVFIDLYNSSKSIWY